MNSQLQIRRDIYIHIRVFLYIAITTFVVASLLEAPQRDISNEYPHYMVAWRNKKQAGKTKIRREHLKIFLYFAENVNSYKLAFLFVFIKEILYFSLVD